MIALRNVYEKVFVDLIEDLPPGQGDTDLLDTEDAGGSSGARMVGHHSFCVEVLLATALPMAFTSASIQFW